MHMNLITESASTEDLDILLQSAFTQMKREYIRGVNRDLARHKWQGSLARNIEAVLYKGLQDLEPLIEEVTLCLDSDIVRNKMLDLTHRFVAAAVTHNRTSCALSNFASEHRPEQNYLDAVAAQSQRQLEQFFEALNLAN